MGDHNVCSSCGGQSLDPPGEGCETPTWTHPRDEVAEQVERVDAYLTSLNDPDHAIDEADEEHVEYVPRPGDFCRFVGHNPVTHIEHHAPCPDGHPTGTLTDARTGKVVSEPPPQGFAAPYAQRNQP